METREFKEFAINYLREYTDRKIELRYVQIKLKGNNEAQFEVSAFIGDQYCIGCGKSQLEAVQRCIKSLEDYRGADAVEVLTDNIFQVNEVFQPFYTHPMFA